MHNVIQDFLDEFQSLQIANRYGDTSTHDDVLLMVAFQFFKIAKALEQQ